MKIPAREPSAEMSAVPIPNCAVCGSAGVIAYQDLVDRLYGVPGRWTLRRCPRDGLAWLDPRPLESDLPLLYESYYTHGNAATYGPITDAWEWISGAVRAGVFGHPRPQSGWGPTWLGRVLGAVTPLRDMGAADAMWLRAGGGRLLDVGCGDGRFLSRMRTAGWDVFGVEFDKDAAAAAAARGLPVHRGTVAQLDGAGGFDAITLSHVVEHVSDPVGLLHRCWQLLRPGGRLVVLTPNVESLGHRVFGRSWRGLEPPRHLYVFSRASLARLAQRAVGQEFTIRSLSRSAPFNAVMSLASANQPATRSPLRLLAAMFLFLAEAVAVNWGEELLLIGRKPLEAGGARAAR